MKVRSFRTLGIEEFSLDRFEWLPPPDTAWAVFSAIDLKPHQQLDRADDESRLGFCVEFLRPLANRPTAANIGGTPGGENWRGVNCSEMRKFAEWWVAEGCPDFLLVDLESREGFSLQDEEVGITAFRKKL